MVADGDTAPAAAPATPAPAAGCADEHTAARFPRCTWAFKDWAHSFGPEQFSALQRGVKEECAAPSLELALALLRLADGDSDVFLKVKSVLIDKGCLPYSAGITKMDMMLDVAQVRARDSGGAGVRCGRACVNACMRACVHACGRRVTCGEVMLFSIER